jgi:hypothetical protein
MFFEMAAHLGRSLDVIGLSSHVSITVITPVSVLSILYHGDFFPKKIHVEEANLKTTTWLQAECDTPQHASQSPTQHRIWDFNIGHMVTSITGHTLWLCQNSH